MPTMTPAPHDPGPARKPHGLVLPLAVAASVVLFACGETAKEPSAPRAGLGAPQARPGPSPADHASRGTQPVVSAPAALAAAAAPAPAVPPVPAAPGPAAPAEITFGTPPEEPEIRAPRLTETRRPLAGSRVFSNKDLESYRAVKEEFGFRDNVQRVDLTRRAAEAPAEEALTAAERERQMSETKAKINTLVDELQYLQKRVPSLHNPLLPRASVREADAAAEAGLDNAERLSRVNRRISEVNGELGTLQRRLADLTTSTPADRPPSPGGGD